MRVVKKSICKYNTRQNMVNDIIGVKTKLFSVLMDFKRFSEGGLGWGTHVNPWLFHFNVWQNPPQIKKKKEKKRFSNYIYSIYSRNKIIYLLQLQGVCLTFLNVNDVRIPLLFKVKSSTSLVIIPLLWPLDAWTVSNFLGVILKTTVKLIYSTLYS